MLRRYLLGLLVLGCQNPAFNVLNLKLEADPLVILPPVFVGFSGLAVVKVTNVSRAPISAHLTTEPPYGLEREQWVVPGGATVLVAVRFSPTTPGDYEGLITISGGERPVLVRLKGAAMPAPVCASTSCHVGRFDPEAGLCLEDEDADGTPCEDACLANAVCRQGQCAGVGRNCDDGNPCTLDACDGQRGCVHAAIECAVPLDPCQAAFCDPQLGCASAPAPDGTSCGAFSCGGAHLCVAGQCRQVAVPDGTLCAKATPCQEEGRCSAGVCAQPDEIQLTPAWEYPLDTTWALPFYAGILTEDGTSFVVERRPGRAHFTEVVIAINRDGQEIWRTANDYVRRLAPSPILLVGGDLLYGPAYRDGKAELVAFDRFTGQVRWTSRIWDVAQAAGLMPETGYLSVKQVLGTTEGVAVLADLRYNDGLSRSIFLRVDATGRASGLRTTWTEGERIANSAGEVFSITHAPDGELDLMRLDPEADTFVASFGHASTATALAVGEDVSVIPSGVFQGAPTLSPWQDMEAVYFALASGHQGYAYAKPTYSRHTVVAFDPIARMRSWTLGIADGDLGPAEMTSDGSLLALGHWDDGSQSVIEISPGGHVKYSCRLAPPAGSAADLQDTSLLIHEGRLILAGFTSLRAFDIGVRPAKDGWIVPGGSPGGTSRPVVDGMW